MAWPNCSETEKWSFWSKATGTVNETVAVPAPGPVDGMVTRVVWEKASRAAVTL